MYPLFSSSSGNSSFVGTPTEGILIDAGVSCKRITDALLQNGISASAVKAVFITHDHCDHIAGLRVFTKNFNVPVYASTKTYEQLDRTGCISSCGGEAMEVGSEKVVGGFSVKSFATPHDALQSVGYKISTPDGKTISICTDLGHVTQEVEDNLLGCDLVLLEANYDERMLRSGPYPFVLKQRIASADGHLSNVASAHEVRKIVESGTTRIILGHLSKNNNTPHIVENTMARELCDDYKPNKDFLMYIAPPESKGMVVTF